MGAEDWPVVAFSGVVDLRAIEPAFDRIKQAAGSGVPFVIDCAGIEEADLTFLQLVEAARCSAARAGTQIALRQPAAGAVLEILQRAGFLADPPDERTRFWLCMAAPG